jgi:Zn-finger nucleic acid-binding protein
VGAGETQFAAPPGGPADETFAAPARMPDPDRRRGYRRGMETFSCPRCAAAMVPHSVGGGEVARCPDGHGVFLSRADLGAMIESELDWHRHAGQHTAPMPRITADMTEAPPAARTPARAWVESLFG